MKLDIAPPSSSESQKDRQVEIEEYNECYSERWCSLEQQSVAGEMLSAESVSSVDGDCPRGSSKADRNCQKQSILVTFSTTFFTIFLAEIGDKTQLSTLLMSAQSHSPWIVFLGSGVALVTTSLLGVVLGSWISQRLSPKTVEKGAGLMMLFISLLLFLDVINN